jgi:tripartite-type tricarboxylate transporter receptor subunit TctC
VLKLSAFAWLALSGTLWSHAALAQATADFFQGKPLNLIVGISPGGGYDQYARLLARHYGKHLPGTPTTIVRNMPGAGSLNAVVYTADVATPDGQTVTAFNSGLVNETINDGDKAKVRFDQFAWIGSMARDLRICFTLKETGITSLEDLRKRKAVFGGSGVGSSSANNVAMLKNMLQLDLKIISAYRGNTEMYLAMERGEIEGSCVSWSSVPDHWLKAGRINILTRLSLVNDPAIPASVPFFGDLVKSEDRDVVDYLLASGEIGRPFIASRKVPAERIAALQRGFDAAMRDPDLLSEAEKQNLPISPVNGKEAQQIVLRMMTYPARVIEKARRAIQE